MAAHPDLLRRALLTGTALAGGAILAEAMSPREARAAMTVFDPSNLAKNAETAAQTAQLVLSNKGILQFSEDILGKIGLDGVSSDVASKLFSAGGGISDALGHVRKIEGAGRMLAGVIGKAVSAPTSVDSVQAGLALAVRYGAEGAQTGALGPVAEDRARQRAATVRLAQSESLGAAMFHAEDSAKTGDRVAKLAADAREAAGADGDMRGQLAVLTSAVLVQIEESAKGRQLMAALAAQLALEGQQNYVMPPSADANTYRGSAPAPASNQVFGKE